MTETILQTDYTHEIQHIVHIADIHIRRDPSRDIEYRGVFKQLYEHLSKLNPQTTIIVICGDLLHDGYSPSNIILLKEFISNLTHFMPTILIIGNHDLASRNNYTVNYIAPIIQDNFTTTHQLHLLTKKGLYNYNNIQFGLTTMDSQHIQTFTNNKLIKIGLYHGIINGSTFDNGMKSNNYKFSTTDFINTGADYILLGDIHKFQYCNKKLNVAYSGSIVSQSFGEEHYCNDKLIGHGFILWNLHEGSSKFIVLNNPYESRTIVINSKGFHKDDHNKLHDNMNLRVIYKNVLPEDIKFYELYLHTKYNINHYVQNIDQTNTKVTIGDNNVVVSTIANNKTVINILHTYITQNYTYNTPDLNNIMQRINSIITDLNIKYDNSERIFKLKSLKFDNINVYEQHNSIDFTKLNNAIGLCGSNGVGKSTILQVILFSIYGDTHDGTPKIELINKNKSQLSTVIIFEVNNIEYKIERTLSIKKGTSAKANETVQIYSNNTLMNSKDLNSISKDIYHIVGPMEDLIRTSVIFQKDVNSFFLLSPTDRAKYLFRIFNVDIFSKIAKTCDTRIRSSRQLISNYNRQIYDFGDTLKNTKQTPRIELSVGINRQLIKLNERLAKANEEYNNTTQLLETYTNNKISFELQIQALQKNINCSITKEQLIKLSNKLNNTINYINTLTSELNECNNTYQQTIHNMLKYNNIHNTKQLFDNNKLTKINTFKHHISELKQQLQIIYSVPPQFNIQQLTTKVLQLQKQIKQVQNNITIKTNSNKQLHCKIQPLHLTSNNDAFDKYQLAQKQYLTIYNKFNHNEKRIQDLKTNIDTFSYYKYNMACCDCQHNKDISGLSKLHADYISANNKSIRLIHKMQTIDVQARTIHNNYIQHFNFTCISSHNSHIQSLINKNELLISNYNKDLQIFSMDLDKYTSMIDKINNNDKDIEHNNNINTRINAIAHDIELLEKTTFTDYDDYINCKNTLTILDNKICKFKQELCDQTIARDSLDKQIGTYQKNIDDIVLIDSLTHKLHKVLHDISQITLTFNKITQQIQNINNTIIEHKITIKNIDKIKQQATQLESINFLDDQINQIINSDKFVDSIFNQIIPTFSYNVNSLLSIMASYQIFIQYSGIKTKRIDVYKICGDKHIHTNKISGFESDLLNLAFRITINNMNKHIKTDFIVLDELFSSFDSSNIEKLTNVFDYMKTKYKWFMVISHNEYIKKWMNSEIHITHINKISSVNYR